MVSNGQRMSTSICRQVLNIKGPKFLAWVTFYFSCKCFNYYSTKYLTQTCVGDKKVTPEYESGKRRVCFPKMGFPRTEIFHIKMLRLTWPGCVLVLGSCKKEGRLDTEHRTPLRGPTGGTELVVSHKELMFCIYQCTQKPRCTHKSILHPTTKA